MTETNVAGAMPDAQPSVDANSIDGIINDAFKDAPKEPTESDVTDDEGKEEAFPKKAVNAISRRDKQIGKLRAEREAALTELAKYQQQAPQQKQGGELSPAKTGIPSKLNQNDFTNYADFIEARAEEIADFKIDKRFSEHDTKQQESQNAQKISVWEAERSTVVDKMANEFAKEAPDINDLFNEHAETVKEYPQSLKHALLAAENPPLAFYNLAKEGKLEELADMSLEDAKVEIRLAQMKPAMKPKTKAPAPMSASRGSVAPSKSIENSSPDEIRKWLRSS